MLYMGNSGQTFSKRMITEENPVSGVHYFNAKILQAVLPLPSTSAIT